ncbi:hypothetical protein DFJ73DRAFT_647551, partial [Zopfochytrium polystomum]
MTPAPAAVAPAGAGGAPASPSSTSAASTSASALGDSAVAAVVSDLAMYYDDELERLMLRDEDDLLDPFSDPQPGMAAVFRVMSTIFLMLVAAQRKALHPAALAGKGTASAAAPDASLPLLSSIPKTFDSRRLWRIATRLKVIAVDLNRIAANPKNRNTAAPNPTDGLFPESASNTSVGAVAVEGVSKGAAANRASILETVTGMVGYGSVPKSSSPPSSPAPSPSPAASNRGSLWRQSSGSFISSLWGGSKLQTVPSHRNPAAFLAALETVKAFFQDTLKRDILRTVCCRSGFEQRIEAVQVLIVSWAEDVSSGARNRELWTRQDENDKRHDLWVIERALAQIIALQTGDKALLERLRKVRSLATLPVAAPARTDFSSFFFSSNRKPGPPIAQPEKHDADGSASPTTSSSSSTAASDTDEEPFNLLPYLRIEPGLLADAEKFTARTLKRYEDLARDEAETEALFSSLGSAHMMPPSASEEAKATNAANTPMPQPVHPSSTASTPVGFDEALVRRFLALVAELLGSANRKGRGAIAPTLEYREDEEYVNVYDIDSDVDGGIPLGPAGFGESVKAIWRKDGASGDGVAVVMKRLCGKKELPDIIREELDAELKAWARLTPHDHVAVILGFSTSSTPPFYLTAPHTKHGNLLAYVQVHPGHALRLLHEATQGLVHLHSNGILHGSLHAANILIEQPASTPGAPSAPAPRAVVTDFGMFGARGWLMAEGACNIGWRRWTAPEVLRSGGFGPKPDVGRWSAADVYSFAMVCFEVVSGGRRPFDHLDGRSNGQSAPVSLAGGSSLRVDAVGGVGDKTPTVGDDEEDSTPFDDLEHEHGISRLIMYDAARPVRPPNCPDMFWSFISACWRQDPLHRPSLSTVEEKLRQLLKMQSRFRRQSQIKMLSEAFLVEVPLNDLMESVVEKANGSGTGAPATETAGASAAMAREMLLGEDTESSNGSAKIRVNLAFSLDGVVGPPHPATQAAFGIDLPPSSEREGKSDGNDSDEEAVEDEGALQTLDTCDDLERQLWTRLRCETKVASSSKYFIEWAPFAELLRARYPTIVLSTPLRRALTTKLRMSSASSPTNGSPEDPTVVTLHSLRLFLSKRASPSISADVDRAFSFFCLAADAETNPTSKGPVDERRLRECITYMNPTCTLPTSPAASPLHLIVSIPIDSTSSSALTSSPTSPTPTAPTATAATLTTATNDPAPAAIATHLALLDAVLASAPSSIP